MPRAAAGAAERRVRPMGEYKPFTYSATQWAAIRREVPSLPATSSRQIWSTIPRRIPFIVGSGEVRPRDPKWADHARKDSARVPRLRGSVLQAARCCSS
jgi:hypothetical protein